jgi:uncharacterized protein YuzE
MVTVVRRPGAPARGFEDSAPATLQPGHAGKGKQDFDGANGSRTHPGPPPTEAVRGRVEPARDERRRVVDKVRVYYDRTGNTLTVWFDDPQQEYVCEEIGDDVILMKDRAGRVIGLERLNYLSREQLAQEVSVPVEVQTL